MTIRIPWQPIVIGALICPIVALSVTTFGPGDIRQNLFAACFLNEHEGWVVGELGRIFHTTDGGKSFARLATNTKNAFTGVACFPDKSLVVVGPNGVAMRSRDAGKSWTVLPTGTKRNLLSVAFSNPATGIAVGDFGTIVRTEDGGDTWEIVPVPDEIPLPEWIAETINPGDVLLYDADFVTPERGWIVGEFGVIFSTSDGGRTWTAQQSPIETTLFGVDFTDPERGWAVGLESVMLRTSDGGATWNVENIPMRREFGLSLYDVAVEGQIGWAIGDSGYLLKSSDGGVTWSQVELPIELAGNWFRGVSLTPAGDGFVVGGEGLMLRTERDRFQQLRRRS